MSKLIKITNTQLGTGPTCTCTFCTYFYTLCVELEVLHTFKVFTCQSCFV